MFLLCLYLMLKPHGSWFASGSVAPGHFVGNDVGGIITFRGSDFWRNASIGAVFSGSARSGNFRLVFHCRLLSLVVTSALQIYSYS